MTPGLDWEAIFWEARGYLGLDEGAPVPREELLEQAKANGWSERDFQEALRETDQVELAGDDLDGDLQLVDDDVKEDNLNDTPVDGLLTADVDDDSEPDWDGDADVVYSELDWTDVEDDVYPEAMIERDAWIPWTSIDGRKQPYAPYAQTENAYSWSDIDNWTDFESARDWTEKHPQLKGITYILQEEGGSYADFGDPFLFVDGDDVRDPETGDVSPAFIELLEQLGETYTDISTSGTGSHALYRGELPEDVRTVQYKLPDDQGEVEIYDQRRVCVMTGQHVAGTPTTIDAVDEAALEDVVDEHATRRSTNVDREDWEPDFDRDELDGMDSTSNIQAIFDAVRQVEPRDIRLRSSKTEERADGTLSFDPTFDTSRSGTRLGWDPDIGWIYRKGDRGLDVLQVVALEERIISSVDDYPTSEDFWRAIEALRDRGARIPEYETTSSGTGAGSTQYNVEICDPPQRTAETFDREERWEEIQEQRLEAAIEDDKLHLFGDEAGAGKTTNAALGSLQRERAHTVYFDKHLKARGFVTDNAIADFEIDVFDDPDYFHLRGAEQKRHGHCMDADHADEDCPEHGSTHDCSSMCPVYDLEKEHPTREIYEALVREVGPNKAHQILELQDETEHPWHEGECAWQAQYSALETEPYVAGVHPYMTQKSAHDTGLNIIDETPGLDAFERSFSVRDLTRIANSLDRLSDLKPRDDPVKYTAQNLAAFTREVVDVLTDIDGPDAITELEAPTIVGNAYETFDDAAGNYLECEEPEEDWQLANALAKTKVDFGETILTRMQNDNWEGTPISIDVVLTAAAEAGLDVDPVMQTVAIPPILDACPWCQSELTYDNGAHCCTSDDCDWHEAHNTLIHENAEAARAMTWVKRDPSDAPIGLAFRSLPLPSELPDPSSTIVLDATANRKKVATLFDIPLEDVEVSGDEPLEMPGLQVTQVLDGQYHAGTIEQAIDEERSLADRIQRTIDTVGTVHEKPLFICKSSLIAEFDFPESAEVLHYHATRGLNRNDCDAVVCIGAPHPKLEDTERDAQLLAMNRDDVDVGGAEHSTRDGAENPPVYRKLFFEDEHGRGRAVPTKRYTGLVGALFEESRESELVQAVHRMRPLLADEDDPKHAYLLTNVPTALPVDEVATFKQLADPLRALMPIPEGAIELLGHVERVLEGNGPDGFRAEALVDVDADGAVKMKKREFHRLATLCGMDVTYATVSRYVNGLEEVGLLEGQKYEQHAGVTYASDLATFISALQVLSDCGSLKVAACRRFRSIVTESGSALDWLAWAREVFDLEFPAAGLDSPPDAAN